MRSRDTARYAIRQQERLDLRDWRIGLRLYRSDHIPPDDCEGMAAHGSVDDWDMMALSVTLRAGIGRPVGQVRETIRHEILHVRLAEQETVFEQALRAVRPEAREILRTSYKQAQERAINALAKALED